MKQQTIAIAGNPNSGKTTAFNKYTGARQHVGNYPGITVEKKEGTALLDGEPVLLVDLPGTYSLSAYSLEEVVARNVLAEERPGAVINVLNAGVLERNLYLTVQLLEMGVPMVLVLNMMDEARAQGLHIDPKRLEELTGLRAIPAVARTGEGLDDALRAAKELAEQKAGQPWDPLIISYGSDIDNALLTMIPIIEEAHLLTEKYAPRWTALKFLERDEDVIKQAQEQSSETCVLLEQKVAECEKHLEMTLRTYPEAMIADYRYGYISSILRQGVISCASELQDRIAYSDKMDAILTNRFLGPLILIGILYCMYFITFVIGEYPKGWVEGFFGWLTEIVSTHMDDGLLKSMIISGAIAGVGGVLSFVPLIMVMFFLIAFLEDSGYMARVAYMMDRIFRFFGLHGASVMPFIVAGGIAGGCAIPGIMAARTLRSPKERLATILTAPFMACGAKLPIFILFVNIFFTRNKALVMFTLTLAGWLAALLVARLFRSTLVRGAPTPFVMELPPYRFPTVEGMVIHTWERAWQYIKKAGTIILAISILLWAAMTFPHLPEAQHQEFEAKRQVLQEKFETSSEAKKIVQEMAELEEKLEAMAEADESTKDLEELIQDLEMELKSFAKSHVTDSASERVEAELTAAQAAFAETEKGKLTLSIQALEDSLAALPGGEAYLAITDLDNEEAQAALRHSIAGRVGIAFEDISRPAGFDWRTNIALIGGIAAKEVIISTLGTAYSLGDVDPEEGTTLATRIAEDPQWSRANAVALLLFTLLYSPCFVAVVMISRETGSWKWAVFSVFFNLGFAYLVAVAANQLLRAI